MVALFRSSLLLHIHFTVTSCCCYHSSLFWTRSSSASSSPFSILNSNRKDEIVGGTSRNRVNGVDNIAASWSAPCWAWRETSAAACCYLPSSSGTRRRRHRNLHRRWVPYCIVTLSCHVIRFRNEPHSAYRIWKLIHDVRSNAARQSMNHYLDGRIG